MQGLFRSQGLLHLFIFDIKATLKQEKQQKSNINTKQSK